MNTDGASPGLASCDPASEVQECLDKLVLSLFNSLLEVSRTGPLVEVGQWVDESVKPFVDSVQEIRQSIAQLLPPADETRDAVSLKSLQAEYESVQHHLEESIQESDLLSSSLRQTLTQDTRERK